MQQNCKYGGEEYSPGSLKCQEGSMMRCEDDGTWSHQGNCSEDGRDKHERLIYLAICGETHSTTRGWSGPIRKTWEEAQSDVDEHNKQYGHSAQIAPWMQSGAENTFASLSIDCGRFEYNPEGRWMWLINKCNKCQIFTVSIVGDNTMRSYRLKGYEKIQVFQVGTTGPTATIVDEQAC